MEYEPILKYSSHKYVLSNKKPTSKKSKGLAKLFVGAVIASAMLLPSTGCIEYMDYNYSRPIYRTPSRRTYQRPIIIRPSLRNRSHQRRPNYRRPFPGYRRPNSRGPNNRRHRR